MTAFRADGTTPVLPNTVTQCETIIYQATLFWGGGTALSFSGGTMTITTPDNVPHDATPVGGIPCIGDPVNSANGVDPEDQCLGTPGFINSQQVSFTANVADCAATPFLDASITYEGGVAHLGDDNVPGIGGFLPLSIPVVCCAQDDNFCNGVEFCDPATVGQFCAGGVVCDPSNTGGDGVTHTGTCANGPAQADSTPCDTDTDPTDCTAPGCAGGVCVQTHIPVNDSTPCGTDETPGDCTTPGCAGGVCVQTHIPVDDSTPCGTDETPDDCTAPGCAGGACVQTHIEIAPSTPCGPDTDGLTCTIPGCAAGGICNQTHVSDCEEAGRMTGGGSVFTSEGQRVTHGFELHCDEEVGPNNLEVNWGGNHFHLEILTSATCSDDPSIEPPPPAAPFDTYVGEGTGRCNGVPGATITFTFTDAGEPGTEDTATIDITCSQGGGISVSNNLNKGNHQAHSD
jgi:hypothetical protein